MDQALSKDFKLNPMPEASRQRGSKHGGVQAHAKKRLDKFMRCRVKLNSHHGKMRIKPCNTAAGKEERNKIYMPAIFADAFMQVQN